jgi:hypothetical protein
MSSLASKIGTPLAAWRGEPTGMDSAPNLVEGL